MKDQSGNKLLQHCACVSVYAGMAEEKQAYTVKKLLQKTKLLTQYASQADQVAVKALLYMLIK